LAACGGGGAIPARRARPARPACPEPPAIRAAPPAQPPRRRQAASALPLRNLVSDGTNTTNTDPPRNGWGIAFNPQGFVWVSDAGTSKSTLYDGNGVPQSLVVDIPAGSVGPAVPTASCSTAVPDFRSARAASPGASPFIFVGVTGTVAGWSPTVNMTKRDPGLRRRREPRFFTGVTLASQGAANFLYVADFHNAAVDVFDANFAPWPAAAGGFNDPNLPVGYAPFGMQTIGGNIYVSYAMRMPRPRRSTSGPGLGIVDEFDSSGTLIKRLITGGR